MKKKSKRIKRKEQKKSMGEITNYDITDTTSMIDSKKPLKYEDLGLELPDVPPTQVVSIRLPTALLNEIKAIGSEQDVPYQALIKLWLAESLAKKKAA